MKNRETGRISSRCLLDMSFVQVVSGEDVAYDFPRHVHSAVCIGIVDRGVRVVSWRGESIAIPEDGFFVINRGVPHSCRSRDGEGQSYRIACVDIDASFGVASRITGQVQPIPHFPKVLLADPELAHRLRRFFSLACIPGPSLARESLFFSFLADLILRHGAPRQVPHREDPRKDAIERVCDFIRANHTESITLERLCRIACLSPFHFHRVFVGAKGISPHDYLVHCRVRKARELLLKGYGIAGAATETGFADQSHFTRCFKRLMGTTPGRYLKSAGRKAS